MLPALPVKSLDTALRAIAFHDAGKRSTLVRVIRLDGSAVEGVVMAIDENAISLHSDTNGLSRIAPADVRRIEIRVARRQREWTLAALGICATTAALVGLSRLPLFGPKADFTGVVMVLVLGATAAAPFVLARTPLGRWLRRWETLVDLAHP